MLPGPEEPVFDGRGTSFLDSVQQAHLRMHTTKTDPAIRAPFLVSHTHSAPRQVCLAAREDCFGNQDGVAGAPEILRKYFAPEAADAICHQVMRFMQFRRAGQSIHECIVEFDLLRREAESKVEVGDGFS